MEKQLLVSTEWLGSHLHAPDLIVLDVRHNLADPQAGKRAYSFSHIPEAYFLHLDHDLSGPATGHNGRHPLPSAAEFGKLLRKLGVTPDKILVAYDDSGGAYAARLWWMMRWIGLYNCAVLDGGWQKWVAEHRTVTQALPVMHESDHHGFAQEALKVSADHILTHLHDRDAMLVVDARSPDRFRGENETIDPVAGHIPGAVNRFFQHNLTASGTFKPPAELYHDFKALLGERSPSTVVSQCGSGVTACHNLLAMELAGLHGAKLYPGSWSEWCSDTTRPVAIG
ncbi:thiosulfate/3-mercaptopyruvate sulfurtransferase [Chitinivorax tropicus]|uniref:Sulfurtransferase n=1 Tax=Chitinivorax tropicus TaxID=714531 RepID=A0A840MP79_9PROT|nr:sulfurtransferase [Chitinivorax tropicus]MBB5019265.1 thiosulfate/3-mercaptopyruvate sulfurtransferase [Chitinivorax tropicus]